MGTREFKNTKNDEKSVHMWPIIIFRKWPKMVKKGLFFTLAKRAKKRVFWLFFEVLSVREV
jgi:hypothetical protein